MEISTDRYKFLLYVLFGSETNSYIASSKVAYRDFCRTLRLGTIESGTFREYVDAILEERVSNILKSDHLSQGSFDAWHQATCMEIVEHYVSAGVIFTVGHAQKWLNMMMKYLYIRGHANIERVLPHLHVPLDQYIFQAVERDLKIERPCAAWSKLNDYEVYLQYQKGIRKAVEDVPLLWEMKAWVAEASR